jgi:hypothetical protein
MWCGGPGLAPFREACIAALALPGSGAPDLVWTIG